MRKVLKGKEIQESILESIHLLCDAVKITLGPLGENVLISSNELLPYITNDGVTIARNIESDDPVINGILEIAKESSLKTNELVGDGTTTTLVLLEKLIDEGFKVINEGYSPILLKKEMENFLKVLEKELRNLKRKPLKKDYLEVSKLSCNEEELGTFIYEVYQKVKQKNAIHLIETNKEDTTYEQLFGYSLEIEIDSNIMKEKDSLLNPYVLLIDGELENLEEISETLNPILKEEKHLIILANHFYEEVLQECAYFDFNHENKILCLEVPEYANRRKEILKDLEVISSSKIWNKNRGEILSWSHIGKLGYFSKEKRFVLFSITKSKKLEKYQEKLKKEILLCDSEYEKEFLEERYAKLSVGLILVFIGGISKTSIREKKMRMEDAFCALEMTKKGVVVGGGVSLLQIKEKIEGITMGSKVCLSTLSSPFYQILDNCGVEKESVYETLKESLFTKVYNARLNEFESISDTSVKDPFEVVLTSLKNAISIASLLLTTNYFVLNEKETERNIEI